MSDWMLLLPPSESKATPPENGMSFENAFKNKKTNTFKELNPHRLQLFKALEDVMNRQGGWEEIFEVKGAALEEAMRANRRFRESKTMKARELYDGVMYRAIDFKTLKAPEKKLFDEQTLIISGLFGVLKPTDRIPPYKLKIGANLGGAVGKISNYWRAPVSEVLRQQLKGKVVWNLLPDQHARIWDNTGEVKANHQVKFVKRVVRSGIAEWKTISHHSKALKGSLIRHLLLKDPTLPKSLFDFTHPDGYAYAPSLSVESKRSSLLVFAAE